MTLQKMFIIIVLALVGVAVTPTAAQDDAESVVEDFYTWYLNATGYDTDSGRFRSPLTDGTYRDRQDLSQTMIATVDSLVDDDSPIRVDPFLCAQDLPETVRVEAVAADSILAYLDYAWNPEPRTILVTLIETDDTWRIDAVSCQETVTALGTVRTVYEQAVAERSTLDADNPLFTPALQARLREALETERPAGSGDPLLCAQDWPASVSVHPVLQTADRATAVVRQFYSGSTQPREIAVDLVWGERWQIDAIHCTLEAETVTLLVYHTYVRYQRYDLNHNIERTPLADWSPYPWATHIAPDLLETLLQSVSDAERSADPLLCAQDLPDRIVVTAQTPDTMQVDGLYPAGPDESLTVPLAQVTLAQNTDDIWQITAITCSR